MPSPPGSPSSRCPGSPREFAGESHAPARLFDCPDAMRQWCDEQRRDGRSIGLVPTMGALHEGHLSLVRAAGAQTDVCVVTIFVNPSQFAPHEDLSRYPRPLQRDLQLLANEGVDAIFLPTAESMYPAGFGTTIEPPPVAQPLEGLHRPDHFRGVATVVMKYFQIIPADVSFFGQKDYQQLRVIERMVIDLSVPVKIVGCPIVRDPDGLAMSSRNAYLSPEQRRAGLALSSALEAVRGRFDAGVRSVTELQEVLRDRLRELDHVDYAVIVDADTLQPLDHIDRPAVALIAARVGMTRLIDNHLLSN